MKRIQTLIIASALSVALAGCAGNSAASIKTISEIKQEPVMWTDIERESVSLSFIPLCGCWEREPSKVSAHIKTLLAKLLPKEEIIWGPAMHFPELIPGQKNTDSALSPLSDALVLITRNTDTGICTVIFRGTNTISAAEWMLQDFMVQKQVPWAEMGTTSAPSGAMISEGTATAIRLRLPLMPESGEKGAGISFEDELIGLASNAGTDGAPRVLRFTGHSLGGLLAPAFALWAKEETVAKGIVPPNMEIYAFAGPTAGNKIFADYLNSQLPGLRRYASPLDLAPRVWQAATLEPAPKLYEPEIKMLPVTRSLYAIALRIAKEKGYAQPNQAIAVPSTVVPVKGKVFLLEAAYQHMMPYLDILQKADRDTILAEIMVPIAEKIQFRDLKSEDLLELFGVTGS